MRIFVRSLFIFIFLITASYYVQAQPGWTINPFGNEKKPEKYEDKKLPSELTDEKKFTPVRKFIQNTTSRFNYYFNASQKLDYVMAASIAAHKDNYAKMLSFYPYSLKESAAQAIQLDSIIYITTAGILLHDLRSDWVDNMYLLIGQSYFLKNDLDSAALTFQFINYNLYPRKKGEDDYGRVVGGNGLASSGALTIANTEKQSLLKKVTGISPSRNDALIWLIRTHIEKDEFADAAGLINILQQDENMPSRLKDDLAEVNSYWFYAQNMYDSAATHFELALSNAYNKEDLGRREYLLAQMLERTGNIDKASKYYVRSGKHTTDPILEIFAGLSDAKMLRAGGNQKELDNAIARLLKMARKDKYDGYQDILLYSAAQLSLQRPDTLNAFGMLAKSVTYPYENEGYKNASFLQLGNLSYAGRQYKEASRYYDSLKLSKDEEAELEINITERQGILTRLVAMIDIIEKEDSVQAIAAMAPDARDAYIKKMVKQNRKANGLKEEETAITQGANIFPNTAGVAPPDLFPDNNKGEFYFYNASLRSRGFNEFRSKFGKRENTDNWRRKAAGKLNANTGPGGMGDPGDVTDPQKKDDAAITGKELPFDYDGLMSGLPLTPEALATSNTAIATNLLSEAKLFQNELQDYGKAIEVYEEYLRRFGDLPAAPDAYMGLYFSYNKLGDVARAAQYKNTLMNKFAGSTQANMITNPEFFQPNKKNEAVTKQYENVYDLFLEGKFAEAVTMKQAADQLHGNNYWSPQLLYIESVYYIKQKDDSTAIRVLDDLIKLYPESPLAEKAKNMKSVLSRRSEIENYLTNLEVTRYEDDKVIVQDVQAPVKIVSAQKPVVPVINTVPQITNITKTDSTVVVPKRFISGNYTLDPLAEHYVIVVLNKVDPVYINEAKNALTRVNKGTSATASLNIVKDVLNPDNALLVIGNLADGAAALNYYNNIKKNAPREMPWLPANKYSFYIITAANLDILKEKKELDSYKTLLNANYNNIF